MLHKAWNSKEEMPYCFPRSSIKFQGHTGQNITDFDPNWAFPDYRPVAAFKSLRFALFLFKYDCKCILIEFISVHLSLLIHWVVASLPMTELAVSGNAWHSTSFIRILVGCLQWYEIDIYGWLNSLAPGRCNSNFKNIIFKLIMQNSNLGTRCKIAIRWMPQNLTNEKATLVQLMAPCCQAWTIMWANVDPDLWLCPLIVSVGHSELNAKKISSSKILSQI